MAHAADLIFGFGLIVGLIAGGGIGYWFRGRRHRTVI